MKTHSLKAQARTETGKNECNRIRSSGYIPAVMYAHGKTDSLKVSEHEFTKLFRGHISESVLINMQIDGAEAQNVIVKDYQLDPVNGRVLHLDFYKVTSGEKLHTVVPLIIKGTSKGERMGGIMEVLERELEIECLPADMPEKIEIDVTELELAHSIHVRDIKVEGSVRFLTDGERAVVTVLIPKAVKEEAPAEAAAMGVEEAAAAEGAEPKEKAEEK
jgi:large subunit ribosomal protein L25